VKRLLGLLSLVAFVLVFGPSPAQAANVWAATLYQLDGSGISAAATLAEQSDGTVQVVLTASGLKAGVQYISGVYNRSSIACRGGLIRAATTSGFSDTYTSREGGVTFTAQGPLSNVFSISVRETTEGRAPGTERACAERFPASLRATVQQEGSTATITLRLFNLSRETLALADIRGPIPAGMSLVTSSPTAQLVGNEARWLHISDMGPGQTRTFTYRLNTDGLGGSFRGWAGVIGPESNTSTISQAVTINAATVRVSSNPQLGTFLVDGSGRTLYLFAIDEPNTSKCFGGCVRAWPLLTVAGAPSAGPGVSQALLGTTDHPEAPAGTKQVTYNGSPLYTFIRDQKPGDTLGQGLNAAGGLWWVVSPAGTPVR